MKWISECDCYSHWQCESQDEYVCLWRKSLITLTWWSFDSLHIFFCSPVTNRAHVDFQSQIFNRCNPLFLFVIQLHLSHGITEQPLLPNRPEGKKAFIMLSADHFVAHAKATHHFQQFNNRVSDLTDQRVHSRLLFYVCIIDLLPSHHLSLCVRAQHKRNIHRTHTLAQSNAYSFIPDAEWILRIFCLKSHGKPYACRKYLCNGGTKKVHFRKPPKNWKIAQITRNRLITATDLVLQPKVLERSGVLMFSRKCKTLLPEFMEITDLRAA